MRTVDVGELLDAEAARGGERGMEVASALLRDWDLVVLVAHWGDVRVSLPGELRVRDGADAWERLWEVATIDLDQVATMLGTTIANGIRKLDRAAELRLVRPDGTVDPVALRAARALVASELTRRKR